MIQTSTRICVYCNCVCVCVGGGGGGGGGGVDWFVSGYNNLTHFLNTSRINVPNSPVMVVRMCTSCHHHQHHHHQQQHVDRSGLQSPFWSK